MRDWLTAEEAQRRLGVRAQTLYAYVSRGRIRVAADPADPRRSRYRASDVGALVERKARGRKAAEVAKGAIAWGEPVLASAITTVRDGRLYYRGRDAVILARSETLEHAARLLRGGLGDPPTHVPSPSPGATAKARAFASLAARAAVDPPSRGRSQAELAHEAAELLDVMAGAIAGEAQEGPIHERLGQAWRVRREEWPLLRRALVLLADHELNASTFAARVAASTGAALSASALAGLAALSGPRHGGMAAEVEAFALAHRGDIARIARGAAPPGFGHPLYPDGDPRAEALLETFETPPALARLRAVVEEETRLRPNIDFALVALRQALRLAPDAPFALFALARSAGWMAHAMEQAVGGDLIRPRARYVGPDPGG
jgi:citrate synthase